MAAPTASASPTQDAVVRNIRVQMARTGQNIQSLAGLIGKSPDWVSRRLNGKTDIAIPDLDILAPHLQTSPAHLVDGEES